MSTRTSGPSDGSHAAVERLLALTDLVGVRRRQLAAEGGITEAQWQTLEEIATEHFLPSLFANRRECSAAAVSRTLRQLREQGLIEALPPGEDARKRRYALTARGRRRLERIRAARHAALSQVWDDLPARDLDAFVRFSDRVIAGLDSLAAREAGAADGER